MLALDKCNWMAWGATFCSYYTGRSDRILTICISFLHPHSSRQGIDKVGSIWEMSPRYDRLFPCSLSIDSKRNVTNSSPAWQKKRKRYWSGSVAGGGCFTGVVDRITRDVCNMHGTPPPYDNYNNTSKAIYPSVDLPSLLIKITVTFLHDSDNLTHLAGSSRSPINGSTSNISQTGENVCETTETKITTYQFTWSASCLYVGGGNNKLDVYEDIFSVVYLSKQVRETAALNIATVLRGIFCWHHDLLPFHGRTFRCYFYYYC